MRARVAIALLLLAGTDYVRSGLPQRAYSIHSEFNNRKDLVRKVLIDPQHFLIPHLPETSKRFADETRKR